MAVCTSAIARDHFARGSGPAGGDLCDDTREYRRLSSGDGAGESLYVTAPTLATHDAVYRVTRDRMVDVLYSGFGRPQGLAFDSTGALYVVDALAGSSGLYKLDPTVESPRPELIVSAPSLIGVAFDPAGGLVLTSADTVWGSTVRCGRIVRNDPAAASSVRVIDLSRLLPGAFATLMLAEMGAEVIKIEDPWAGDPMRQLPPVLNGRGLYDLLLNRGKKSVVLDLKRKENLEVLDRLIATADVVVESFRPRTARRFGVSGEQLARRHPRLVHCAITGYDRRARTPSARATI
jgi:hypothetical protein